MSETVLALDLNVDFLNLLLPPSEQVVGENESSFSDILNGTDENIIAIKDKLDSNEAQKISLPDLSPVQPETEIDFTSLGSKINLTKEAEITEFIEKFYENLESRKTEAPLTPEVGYYEVPSEPVLEILKQELSPTEVKLYELETKAEIRSSTETMEKIDVNKELPELKVTFTAALQVRGTQIQTVKFTELLQQVNKAESDEVVVQTSELADHPNLNLENKKSELNHVNRPINLTDEIKVNSSFSEKVQFDSDHSESIDKTLAILPLNKPLVTETKIEPQSQKSQHIPPQPVIHQVGMQIKQALDGEQDKVTVHLNPPTLGKIEVELRISDQGHVSAILTMDKSETYDLMQRNPSQLKDMLAESGFNSSNSDLTFNLKGEDSHSQQRQQKVPHYLKATDEQSNEDPTYLTKNLKDSSREVDIYA